MVCNMYAKYFNYFNLLAEHKSVNHLEIILMHLEMVLIRMWECLEMRMFLLQAGDKYKALG